MTEAAWQPEAEDLAFTEVYGDWEPLTPLELRDLMTGFPAPLHPLAQVWMRHDARSPWRVDCPVNPSRDGLWQSKRDVDQVAPLDEVTWVGGDGIRYLDPEQVLFYKALQHRTKDMIDLANTWPLLDDAARGWLREKVRLAYPDHPWQPLLDG